MGRLPEARFGVRLRAIEVARFRFADPYAPSVPYSRTSLRGAYFSYPSVPYAPDEPYAADVRPGLTRC